MNHAAFAAVLVRTLGRAALAFTCTVAVAASDPPAAAPFGPARQAGPDEPDECAVLAALDFADATGAAVSLTGATVAASGDLPARCRVTGRIAPEVGVELWLPTEAWNGKLLVTGCYGMCGSLHTASMEDAVARGYATATTDAGHSASAFADGRWALNDTAREEDFGHRAVHLTTLLARALVEAYYGERPAHAYFRGCSTGGRQALVAAERYPDDFDGIIAGAPFHQELSVPFMIWADRANTGADGRPLLRRAQFELLVRAALATCDGDDGLADGVIGDPLRCAVDPAALACAPDAASGCLSAEQVRAAGRLYAGPPGGPGGAVPGSEHTWERGLIGRDGRPPFFRSIGEDWLRFHAFESDPPGDVTPVFDFERDPPRLATSNARIGFTGRLEGFRAREGRLILWHGWADESLQPVHTLAYWSKAQRENGGAAGMAEFARLYLLPGVEHCGGGPGAGDVDFLTALERWVEAEEAPQALIASRSADSVPQTVRQPRFPPAAEVQRKRPVFPWPDIARFAGQADPLDPANWQRVAPGAVATDPGPAP